MNEGQTHFFGDGCDEEHGRLSMEQKLTKAVNILYQEKGWEVLSTAVIVDKLMEALGEPETIFTLTGEHLKVWISRSSS